MAETNKLAEEVNGLMQSIIAINGGWVGDYIIVIQTSVSLSDALSHYEWYYKPPMSGASGDMAGHVAERPPGYDNPAKIVFTRDDLTSVLRENGFCICPFNQVDIACPQHGRKGASEDG